MSISWTNTFNMHCKTVVIIFDPPGDPIVMIGIPSYIKIVGVIELRGLLLGSIAFALSPTRPQVLDVPGLIEKSSISLFNKNPAPSTTCLLPKFVFSVVVIATALPSLSTTE